VLGDGTSFSSPAVGGLYLSLIGRGQIQPGFDNFRAWWLERVVPLEGVTLPHPKIGIINFEPHYQSICHAIGAWDIAQVPSAQEEALRSVKWLDLRRVS
jgi:hypothetical protein